MSRRGVERFEGRALRWEVMQRAADEPSFARSRDLLVGCPQTREEIFAGRCPLLPISSSSATSELVKRNVSD